MLPGAKFIKNLLWLKPAATQSNRVFSKAIDFSHKQRDEMQLTFSCHASSDIPR